MITKTKIVRMTFGVDEDTGNAWSKEELVKPLTDDEISKIYNNLYESYKSDNVGIADFIMICRAIEKAHGIGEDK